LISSPNGGAPVNWRERENTAQKEKAPGPLLSESRLRQKKNRRWPGGVAWHARGKLTPKGGGGTTANETLVHRGGEGNGDRKNSYHRGERSGATGLTCPTSKRRYLSEKMTALGRERKRTLHFLVDFSSPDGNPSWGGKKKGNVNKPGGGEKGGERKEKKRV